MEPSERSFTRILDHLESIHFIIDSIAIEGFKIVHFILVFAYLI